MTVCFEVNQLQFCYGEQTVLSISSLTLEQGKSYAIMGKNGSGKTTLLNLLAMIEPMQSGELLYQEKAIQQHDKSSLRHSIALVQQKPYLFRSTVYKNIELPLTLRGLAKHERQQRVQAVLERLQIQSLADKTASHLSGGEVQKVAIARALVTEPKVLILDEPFNHLDTATETLIETILFELKDDPELTLLMASHDAPKAYLLADTVLTLVDGHLLEGEAMNIFKGQKLSGQDVFDTGNVQIHLPEASQPRQYVAIDARQLVLSREPLQSSMRNAFFGTITAVNDLQNQVQVSIQAGESFQAIISHGALRDLALHPGDEIWLYCKSSSVVSL